MERWNYAGLPARSWKWHITPNHWIDAHAGPDGLIYAGEDWDSQSGGGYFAGFQTFSEFFADGPLKEMPAETAAEIEAFLVAHRRPGGPQLQLIHHNVSPAEIVLLRAFVNINDSPVKMAADETLREGQVVLYDGEITAGQHELSYALIFGPAGDGDEQWVIRDSGTFDIADQLLRLTLKTTKSGDQVTTRMSD